MKNNITASDVKRLMLQSYRRFTNGEISESKAFKEQIATLQALELEQLYEEQRITSQERITAIASLMHRVREEIDRRDLTQVPTEKLIDLYLKQASTLKEEIIEPNFQSSEEQARDRQEREYLDRLTATS